LNHKFKKKHFPKKKKCIKFSLPLLLFSLLLSSSFSLVDVVVGPADLTLVGVQLVVTNVDVHHVVVDPEADLVHAADLAPDHVLDLAAAPTLAVDQTQNQKPIVKLK
jgi:hypothetical protein